LLLFVGLKRVIHEMTEGHVSKNHLFLGNPEAHTLQVKYRPLASRFHDIIDRSLYLERLSKAVNRSSVTVLLGPRQCGKTTLACILGKEKDATFFNLESQPDRIRLQNPQLMLGSLKDNKAPRCSPSGPC